MNDSHDFFRVEVEFARAPAGANYTAPGRASERFTRVSLRGAMKAVTTGLNLGAVIAAAVLSTTPAFASEVQIRPCTRATQSAQAAGIPGVVRQVRVVRVDADDVFADAQDLAGFADLLRAAPDVDSADHLI